MKAKAPLASHPSPAGTGTSASPDSGICGICWMSFEGCTCSWQLLMQRSYALARASNVYTQRAQQKRASLPGRTEFSTKAHGGR
jgi:hypothetical protein